MGNMVKMRAPRFLFTVITILFSLACVFDVAAQPANSVAVKSNDRDHSHDYQILPDGIIAWRTLSQTAVVTNGMSFAYFTFNFTNVSSGSITILYVDPTCGCTTADFPSAPWTISAGSSGEIKARVDLANKIGVSTEYMKVITEKGSKDLALCIDIRPKPDTNDVNGRR
jgi:hypothetical protein